MEDQTNPTPPSETPTPMDFTEIKQSIIDEIKIELNKAVTGVAGRIKTDLTSDLDSRLNESLKPIIESLTPKPEDGGTDDPTAPPSDLAGQLQTLQERILEGQSKYDQLKNAFEQEKQARISAELSQQKLSATQSFISEAAGMVNKPEQLLKVLEGSIATYRDGSYWIDGKDDYGNPVSTSLAAAIPTIIKQPEFAHFAVPRPGSGTSSGTPTSIPPISRSQYFEGDPSTLIELGKSKGAKSIIEELKKTASN